MSDEDYAAFLQKANKDYAPVSGTGAASGGQISSKAHKAIRALGERFYSSDADEPFVDVTFEWSGSNLPDEAEFETLVDTGSVTAKEPPRSWDLTDSYKDVISAVQEAAGGGSEAAVYRVEETETRFIYYILALDKSHKQLVGVKALSIET
ncbi:hypothetical protein DRE_00014 [Drechslerella stenobrocha 248]|uniref:Uncharacterized protein n=1 Tax=Drechslerella stenobrocha 248 TaxID=1043628 RepID=W7HYX7_9PEZI|nr:hypothetical protein DRE_00014 [Drechslerella stenobrocha 248]